MPLYPYQLEIAAAVLESVEFKRGLTFTVEIARQGGKNEVSAWLEAYLLNANQDWGDCLVKCSPTFKPQTVISMTRLKERLKELNYQYETEAGYMVRVGRARQVFLSAEEHSSVVGHTANVLLEVDEAQDVPEDKYTKEFRPMGSSANVTTVMWGTTWDDTTLLERTKQANLELERKDGFKRHFAFDWQAVAECNDSYRAFVAAERDRLGPAHPLYRTQYELETLSGGGRFLTVQQVAQLQGDHPRRRKRMDGRTVVAGIDIAGESPNPTHIPLCPGGRGVGEGEKLTLTSRDATVVTIAVLNPGSQPLIRVVEHYAWVGRRHAEIYPQLVDLLRNVWQCSRVVVDATGIGEPVASFLNGVLRGHVVLPFKFTQASKSQLGYDLLAAVNAGRLKLYQPDGSEESREMMAELALARQAVRPNETLNFFVDPAEGHDDYLMSLALAVHAANTCPQPRIATMRQGWLL